MCPKPTCSTPNCGDPAHGRGLCKRHYLRDYQQKNAKRLAEYRAAHRDELRARNRAYREAHRDEERARHRAVKAQHRADDPEAVNRQAREWRAKNMDKVRVHRARREERMKAQFVEDVSRAVLRERDGDNCWLCHAPMADGEDTIDHVIPIWRGGEHSYANTRLAHMTCNKRRGGKDSGAAREALKQQH